MNRTVVFLVSVECMVGTDGFATASCASTADVQVLRGITLEVIHRMQPQADE